MDWPRIVQLYQTGAGAIHSPYGPGPGRTRRPAGPAARREHTMSSEFIAIIGAALALAAAILPGQYAMRRDIAGLRRGIADLRERMGRLEGLFEGFTHRESAPPPA